MSTMKLFCPGNVTLNPEDAVPITEDTFLLVADGLGGSGGFAHGSIADDAKINDTFYDCVFKDVFDENLDDGIKNKLKEYIKVSFEKYFALSDEEKSSRGCKFLSGYFASRIVSTLMYESVLSLGSDGVDKIFAAANEDSKKEEERLGSFFAEKLRTSLAKCAENANLIYESKSTGFFLLPTTLVTVIYKEHEDYVEAMYLWAGDARGYSWDENGLIQQTKDHEIDGIITNMVNLSSKFRIQCKYAKCKKPCLLFATSDGCYSCMTAPIDFEYFFFDRIQNASSFDEAEQLLKSMYMAVSSDDTNTVSLKQFGYGSFDEIKAAVTRRLSLLKETYESELPGIFKVNYKMQSDRAKREITKAIKDVSYTDDAELKELVYTASSVLTERNARIEKIGEQIEECNGKLKEIVAEHYWQIVDALRTTVENRSYYSSEDFTKSVLTFINYTTSKEKIVHILDLAEDKLPLEVDKLKEAISELKKNLSDKELKENVMNCCVGIYDIIDIIYDTCDGNGKEVKICNKAVEKLKKNQEKYLEKNFIYVENIARDLSNGTIDADAIKRTECYVKIADLLALMKALEADRNSDEIGEVEKASIEAYWKKYGALVVCEFYQKNPESLFWSNFDGSLIEQIKLYIENSECLKKRDLLYAKYNEYYYGEE